MAAPSIFVVLDPTRFTQPALEKAELIASASGGSLHLYCCLSDDAANTAEGIGEAQRWVERLARSARESRVEVSTNVEWNRDWRHVIAERGAGASMVVKTASAPASARRALLPSADAELLRQCTCPVLLVKTRGAWRGGTVLAAVQVATEDEAHENVRAAVLERAHAFADTLKAALHIVTVDPQRAGWFHVGKFVSRCGVPQDRVHVRRGDATREILELTQELAADVVVLGTVAREDHATRVGHTADKLCFAIGADVLAVPPTSRSSRPSPTQ